MIKRWIYLVFKKRGAQELATWFEIATLPHTMYGIWGK